jgi:hypothetical protein
VGGLGWCFACICVYDIYGFIRVFTSLAAAVGLKRACFGIGGRGRFTGRQSWYYPAKALQLLQLGMLFALKVAQLIAVMKWLSVRRSAWWA